MPEVMEQEETEPAVVPDREPAAAVRKPAVKSAASLAEDTYTSADGKWSFMPYGEGVQITAYHGTATDVYVPFKVTYNEEDYVVLKLADNLFADNDSLNSVTLGEGIVEIGAMTFYDCDNLVCIVTNETLTTIGTEAFYSCDSFNSVILYDAVSTIGENAFAECPSLTVWCNESTAAHTYATAYSIPYEILNPNATPETYIQDGITYYIMNGEAIAIDFDENTTEVIIPAIIAGYPVNELIGTFQGCENLKKVTLPDTLQIIGKNTFSSCLYLEDLVIPNGVTEILDNAFSNCWGITEIVIPDSVTTIGKQLFYGSYYLEKVTLSKSITEIPDSAFLHTDIKEIIIPYGVTRILDSAFQQCDKLERVELPETIEYIGSDAFSNCENLKEITIPDGITEISSFMFWNCKSLETANIPETVTHIYSYAFSECTSLQMLLVPENVIYISPGSIPLSTIMLVYENSYAHKFAVANGQLYFVMRKTENPEISYGAGISGTVAYLDGTDTAGATVEIFYDDGVLKESVVTDENGAYEFTYAEVGAYTIRVTDASGNTATTQVSVKRMNAFDVFLSGDPDLKLKKGYSVSGTVSEYPATVTITDEDGNILSRVETTDGSFTFENVPNGTYIITATTENGSVSQEITVFDGNVSDIVLTIDTTSATLWGYVEVEDRALDHHRRNWVEVTVYNAEGLAVAQTKTDKDGKYTFTGLPAGEYSIVAQTAEMRPDHKHGFERSHTLTGYAYITVTEAATYQVDTIILREENDHKATISGKVTAHGETQNCQVVLHNVFRSEIASMTTGKNGKYSFKNISDGLYFITATTNSDGMGYAVVVVQNGKVYGETDITVYKTDKVKDCEENFQNDVPHCGNREDALKYRDRIAEEKRFYDGLSEKEKKQLSKDYVNRLDQLVQWITDCTVETGDGVTMEQGGLVISGEEAANAEKITFTLEVTPSEAHNASTDGVHNREDQIHHNINDKSGKHVVLQYYDITLSKEVDGVSTQITSVTKDTEANGKLRITLEIPEKYRGYRHYTVVHEHCGEVVTLTDLDDDPNTVTFEVKKFSTFVLAGTNITLTEIVDEESSIVESWGLTLTDNIRVNFTMSEAVLADENAYVEVTAAGKVTNISAADAAKGIQVTLAAAQMNETVTLCIVDGNGDRGESSSYTVRQYCDTILADEKYSQHHQLVKQMLGYGGAAQSYFNYDADNRADADITGIAGEEIPENAEAMTISGAVSGVNYYGASLLFRDKIAVRFYFTGDVTGCSFQINGNPCEITENYIQAEGILPQDLDQQITLTVTDANGNTLTVSYGPMDYIVRMNEKGSDGLKALLKALYNYHLAAKAFTEQQA